MLGYSCFKVCFDPRGKAISYEGGRLPHNLTGSLHWDTAVTDVQDRDHAALGEQNCLCVSCGGNGASSFSQKAEVP